MWEIVAWLNRGRITSMNCLHRFEFLYSILVLWSLMMNKSTDWKLETYTKEVSDPPENQRELGDWFESGPRN